MKASNTRFKIVDDRRELALPACSYFSRTANDDYWIDTDVDSDDGRIYIGQKDAEIIAKMIGWVPSYLRNFNPEELERLRKENHDLRDLISHAVDILSDGCRFLQDDSGDAEESGKGAGEVREPERGRSESLDVEERGGVSETL